MSEHIEINLDDIQWKEKLTTLISQEEESLFQKTLAQFMKTH